MARQTITPVSVSGKWPTAFITLTATAADATNFEKMPFTGREILVAVNTNSGSTARSVTVTSVASPITGRTGDITVSIPAGAYRMIGPLAVEGFRQSDGYLYFQATHAEVKYLAILET